MLVQEHAHSPPPSPGQTYEGGISGKPDAEAHGAYAFCALACLSILDFPHRIIPKYVLHEIFALSPRAA